MEPQLDPRAGAALPIRLGFAAVLLCVFGILLAVGATAPQAMARPLIAGGPLALILVLCVIATAIGTTGLYVAIANRKDR